MKRSRASDSKKKKPIQLLLHSPDGIVPYLTPVLLRKYFPSPQPHLLLGVSVQDTCLVPLYPTPDSNKPKGYEFRAPKPIPYITSSYDTVIVPSFDLLQNATQHKQTQVQATNKSVSVWSPQGRQVLTNEAYQKITATSTSAAAATVALYDMSGPSQSKSRAELAANRSQTWLTELLASTNGQSIWAPVSLTSKPITIPDADTASGYAIVGLNEENVADLREAISKLQNSGDTTIAVLSVTSVESLLHCLEYGVNVIGTNLPTKWSKAHQAFCAPLSSSATKKEKLVAAKSSLLLDLTDKLYARDGSPLVANCACMTCRHYSRAYIHHLDQAKELLAQVLLMGHNLHHMMEFVKSATKARDDDELDAFLGQCRRV